MASRGFYQASSKQVRTLETFIAAEHFFAWIMLQFERGSHGTCDGNAPEIFDFNPRLCLHGPRKTTCDCAKGRRKRTERKAQFFAKSQIGSRGWAKGRTECQSHQAQLFAQSRARLRGRPQGRTCFAPRAEKSRRSSNEASFVKRKQSFVWFRARAPRPRGGSGWLASTTSPALGRRAIERYKACWPHGGTAQLGRDPPSHRTPL
jgi:hypothetical protein